MDPAYVHTTRILSLVVAGLGVAIVVSTIARGGGPLALGVVVGTGLALFGAGRAYLAGGGRREP